MTFSLTEILGLAGTALVVIAYIPQINHLIKEKCSSGISLKAFLLWFIASLFFLVHAVAIKDLVFTLVTMTELGLSGAVLRLTNKYKNSACVLHSKKF